MKYLKTFESFNFDNCRLDKTTIDYIDGKISESFYSDYLNQQFLNEGIIDDIKQSIKNFLSKIKEKFLDILYTFLKKAAEIGFKVFNFFKSFFESIFEKIKKWTKENPVLFKVIIITILVILILMISASTAYAHTTGNPVSHSELNTAVDLLKNIDAAIGYVKLSQSSGWVDLNTSMKAIVHLIDMKDGTTEVPLEQLGDKAIALSETAIKITNKMLSESQSTNDKDIIQKCIDLIQKGSEYVGYKYSQSFGKEDIKLFYK